MHKTSTPVLWAYRDYNSGQNVNDLFIIDKTFDPCEFFVKVIDQLEKNMPDIQDNVMEKIFLRV